MDSDDYLLAKTRIRIGDLREAKRRRQKWAMLTSYDATSARIFDLAKIPVLLVGDSAGQAVFGYKSTLPVTMDELIPLARAVASGCQRALVVVDMPFGSYQESPQVALRNATRFMKEASVQAVKLEGGRQYAEHVKLLTSAGIPVMAHVGFTPQAEHALSGFKIQARDQEAKQEILVDALSLQAAGAFACVLELVPADVGARLQAQLEIPVVGIGAGPHTDAQVLVWTDMVGFSSPKGTGISYMAGGQSGEVSGQQKCPSKSEEAPESTARLELAPAPKFVRRYANVSEIIFQAACAYAADVRAGRYPAEEQSYK